MQDFFTSAWQGILGGWWHIFWVSGICFLLELAWPASHYSLKSRLRGGLFWSIYLVITVITVGAFSQLWEMLHIQPLYIWHLESYSTSPDIAVRSLAWIAVPLIAGAVGEFFYYWFHRAQHTWGWLWKFHAVHHSLEEMNAFNSNHHFSEQILRIPFITIPMSFLIGVSTGPTILAMTVLMWMQGQYEHSCTKFNFGIFRYVVADNRFHRLHHSLDERHWNHNYGSFLPIWDMVFRTAVFPQKGEWPAVGLHDRHEPKTVMDFLFRPFGYRQRASEAQPLQTKPESMA